MHALETLESLRIASTLVERTDAGADAVQIAAATIALWREIDRVLAPILGRNGVATLYKRSLHLTCHFHPWLRGTHEGVLKTIELAALQSALAKQAPADAAAASADLLRTFHELLTSLIGPLLTEQLLGAVWATSSSGAPAQDTSP